MAKRPCLSSPLLYFIIPIILLFVFGDILFDVGFFSRSVQVQRILPTNADIYRFSTFKQKQPIFFDQQRFHKLTEYHANINSKHPTSWIHLNNQLFCPIKYSISLNPINTISNAAERLLKAIYNLQFLNDCSDHKFLILDAKIFGNTGLGAITNAFLIKFLFRALMTNRTLLFDGKWQWSSTQCDQQYNALECYFMTPSNCNITEIIHSADKKDYYIGNLPDPHSCNLGNFDDDNYSATFCEHRIIHIINYAQEMSYHPIMKTINDKMMDKYKCNYQCFRGVATAFMYRLQPDTLSIIFDKVRHSIVESIDDTFNPLNTVSLPIRATDKCRKEGYGGEMDCWSVKEYIAFLKSVKYLSFGRINTVIITSESIEMITEMRNSIDENEWNIILNIDDTMPKSGSAKLLKYGSDDIFGKDLKHDVIIGALSSLLLQMNSKYIAFTRSSNWLDNLWNIGHELNCEQIFWKDLLSYNDKGNYYFSFNKQCFEFRQFGVLNKKVKEKHILYPIDLWDIIHEKHLEPDTFNKMFGVNITAAGWKTYCDRYLENPFVDALNIV